MDNFRRHLKGFVVEELKQKKIASDEIRSLTIPYFFVYIL